MTKEFAERIVAARQLLNDLSQDLIRANDQGAAGAVKRARRELEHPSALGGSQIDLGDGDADFQEGPIMEGASAAERVALEQEARDTLTDAEFEAHRQRRRADREAKARRDAEKAAAQAQKDLEEATAPPKSKQSGDKK